MPQSLSYLLIVLLALISLNFNACQIDNVEDDMSPGNRKSPIAIASVKDNGTYIKVVYGQPYRNGREIFGDLVPYGEVWRTGANEATEITITNTVLMAGESVQAGTYTLFTIPGEYEWTIILNSTLGQWGAFDYTSDTDYKRFTVPSSATESQAEAFSISFTNPNLDLSSMDLKWGNTKVEIPVRFY